MRTLLQICALTVAVLVASSCEQAFSRQGVMVLVIASFPVVHWHLVSVAPQPELAIAVVKQEMEQDGRSAMDCAKAKVERERTDRKSVV